MSEKVDLRRIYAPSEDVVARKVQDEFIIIPISSGVTDLEDEIFTLNNTGKAIWDKLDGKKSLENIASELASDFDASPEEIKKDITGLVRELLKRRILVEIK